MSLYQKAKALFDRYERYLMPGMLLVGVAVDFFTFRSIEIRTAFSILIVYAAIAGGMIFFLNRYEATDHEGRGRLARYSRLAAPLLLQFTFGALLSASLIFYWFSGTISVSWPFFIIIAILMVSNDVFRHYYLKPTVQLSVYFFILFSILSLILPFAFNSISAWLFLASGIAAIILIHGFYRLLSKALPHLHRIEKGLQLSVASIFIALNALYFLGVIPPIPLSLREAGVYHQVSPGVVYELRGEEELFFERLIPGQTLRLKPGAPAYLYSAIFAPADLNTKIVHDWQYFDPEDREWISRSRPSFSIAGGRDAGYRGFSFNSRMDEGRWRIDVETERGQVLGRVRFRIKHVEETPSLITITR